MREIILVRHGQSQQHIRDITGGWSDTHLTDLGCRQARQTAVRLAAIIDGQPVQLFSSDLGRAVQTAEPIGAALGISPQMCPGLRELNNGQAAGLTQQAAKAIALPVTQPTIDWVPYPGAESWRQMTQRVFDCLDQIDPQAPGTAIIISHGNSGVAAIHWWLRLCQTCRKISFELAPCSITRLTVNNWDERTLALLNDTSHLGA